MPLLWQYGSPGAMLASRPVPVRRWPSFSISVRAAKCVFAPQSKEMTASGANASPRAAIAVCGRIGARSVAATRRISSFQSRMRDCAVIRKLRSCL